MNDWMSINCGEERNLPSLCCTFPTLYYIHLYFMNVKDYSFYVRGYHYSMRPLSYPFYLPVQFHSFHAYVRLFVLLVSVHFSFPNVFRVISFFSPSAIGASAGRSTFPRRQWRIPIHSAQDAMIYMNSNPYIQCTTDVLLCPHIHRGRPVRD